MNGGPVYKQNKVFVQGELSYTFKDFSRRDLRDHRQQARQCLSLRHRRCHLQQQEICK